MARTELDLNWKRIDVAADESRSARNIGDPLQELLTVDEVAALLKVSKSWSTSIPEGATRVDRDGWST
jgi:hypothetical protein